jgi:hypothetical protein
MLLVGSGVIPAVIHRPVSKAPVFYTQHREFLWCLFWRDVAFCGLDDDRCNSRSVGLPAVVVDSTYQQIDMITHRIYHLVPGKVLQSFSPSMYPPAREPSVYGKTFPPHRRHSLYVAYSRLRRRPMMKWICNFVTQNPKLFLPTFQCSWCDFQHSANILEGPENVSLHRCRLGVEEAASGYLHAYMGDKHRRLCVCTRQLSVAAFGSGFRCCGETSKARKKNFLIPGTTLGIIRDIPMSRFAARRAAAS